MRWTGPRACTAATSAGAPLTEEVYSFRPAPLRGPQDWRLEEGRRLIGPDGPCDLSGVARARFIDSTMRGLRMRRLDLIGPDGLMCRIALNSRKGLPPQDPDRAAHRALCLDVLRTLTAQTPDLPVALKETGALRVLWFGIGLLALIAGPGIAIAAVATGVDADRLIPMLVPVLLLGAFGAFIAWTHAPWRKVPSLPVSIMPTIIETMDGVAPPTPKT